MLVFAWQEFEAIVSISDKYSAIGKTLTQKPACLLLTLKALLKMNLRFFHPFFSAALIRLKAIA